MGLQRIVEIDVERCLKGLVRGRRFLLLCLILGLLGGGICVCFFVDDRDRYEAEASVYSIAYGSYTDSERGVTAIRTYSDIIKSYKVAERAALLLGNDSLTKEDIYDMILTDERVIEGTTYVYENLSSVIRIWAEFEDRQIAVQVANAVADAFVLEVNSISEVNSTQVLDYAYDAQRCYHAILYQTLVMAAWILGALLVGCCVIWYRIIFSKAIVSAADASLYGQLEVIGTIPRF